MKNKPLDSSLPGRYGQMTEAEFDAMAAKFDRPIPLSETQPLTPAQRKLWERAKRKPGRPPRGSGARVISLSVEQSLLKEADVAARRAGLSRAALFELGLRNILPSIRRKAG